MGYTGTTAGVEEFGILSRRREGFGEWVRIDGGEAPPGGGGQGGEPPEGPRITAVLLRPGQRTKYGRDATECAVIGGPTSSGSEHRRFVCGAAAGGGPTCAHGGAR